MISVAAAVMCDDNRGGGQEGLRVLRLANNKGPRGRHVAAAAAAAAVGESEARRRLRPQQLPARPPWAERAARDKVSPQPWRARRLGSVRRCLASKPPALACGCLRKVAREARVAELGASGGPLGGAYGACAARSDQEKPNGARKALGHHERYLPASGGAGRHRCRLYPHEQQKWHNLGSLGATTASAGAGRSALERAERRHSALTRHGREGRGQRHIRTDGTPEFGV